MAKRFPCPFGQNNLIHSLSSADRALIEPNLKPVVLSKGMVLEEAGIPAQLAYFPKSGVSSTVAENKSGRQIEVGLFGYEGMSGTAIVLQTDHFPNKTFMQIPGEGFSIEPGTLRELLEQSPSLHRHLLRYMQATYTQVSQDSAVERARQAGRTARAVAADVS